MTSSNGNISALLALCAGNSPATGEFPSQRPLTRSFDVFFDLRRNRQLSKKSDAGDLRRRRAHYDFTVMSVLIKLRIEKCQLLLQPVAEKSSKWRHFDGILPKGPYPTCLRMADKALLAGYPRFLFLCAQISIHITQSRTKWLVHRIE